MKYLAFIIVFFTLFVIALSNQIIFKQEINNGLSEFIQIGIISAVCIFFLVIGFFINKKTRRNIFFDTRANQEGKYSFTIFNSIFSLFIILTVLILLQALLNEKFDRIIIDSFSTGNIFIDIVIAFFISIISGFMLWLKLR